MVGQWRIRLAVIDLPDMLTIQTIIIVLVCLLSLLIFRCLLQVQICTYLKKEYGEQSVFAKKENVIKSKSIKVLTQYNAQRHLLEEKLKQLCTTNNNLFHPEDIDVSTVVSSQGTFCAILMQYSCNTLWSVFMITFDTESVTSSVDASLHYKKS